MLKTSDVSTHAGATDLYIATLAFGNPRKCLARLCKSFRLTARSVAALGGRTDRSKWIKILIFELKNVPVVAMEYMVEGLLTSRALVATNNE